jgi:hypothetical protein
MISHLDQQRLRPFLLPGERLLWTGTPERGLSLRARDLWLLPLVAAWTAVNLTPPGSAVRGDVHSSALLFLLAAAAILAARIGYETWLRRRLLYSVTNQRVLILLGNRRPRLRSHDLAWLPILDLDQDSPARGTIVIDEGGEPGGWLDLARSQGAKLAKGFRFFRIDRPAIVYDLICRASRDRRAELNRQPTHDFIG